MFPFPGNLKKIVVGNTINYVKCEIKLEFVSFSIIIINIKNYLFLHKKNLEDDFYKVEILPPEQSLDPGNSIQKYSWNIIHNFLFFPAKCIFFPVINYKKHIKHKLKFVSFSINIFNQPNDGNSLNI